MMAFKEDLYEIVEGALTPELLQFIDMQMELNKNIQHVANNIPTEQTNAFDDNQVNNAFPSYGNLATETLTVYLQSVMEQVTDKKLYPTYSYSRIYYTGAEMAVHTDRPSCEYSATVCISVDPEPWEIWFETLEKEHKAIYLKPGDLIVYKGDVLSHWRTTYKGNRQSQIFTHYVDRIGKYRDFKYDKRPYLGFNPDTRMGM